MNSAQLMMLSQLINRLDENAITLEKAYNSSDKEKFEASRNAIIEFYKKIDFIIK
ncbi:MAG: hypothetical protein AABX17_00845 [Nanoarchaeota archaeon]